MNGFVLGKFMPPHRGHVFLCEFAKQYCDHLTILVASMPNEPIPGRLRYEWMYRMFDDGGATCSVVWTNKVLPQEPKDENDFEFWEIWKNEVIHGMRMAHDIGNMKPDVVFASEEYGHKLAASVGARFVPVDMMRNTVPISGTMCRNDPKSQWDFLPDVVKPYFVKRVCVFGPESSGKTTLANALGNYYNTVVVPEYGRTYTEVFGPDVDKEDLSFIVKGHLASVAAAKMNSGPIMIEDTDPVMTAVWSDMLTGERDPWFDSFNDYADLYLLCDVDIPWVDDGTRYFKEETDRKRFFELCEKELVSRNVPYVIIRGSLENRLQTSIEAIDRKFK